MFVNLNWSPFRCLTISSIDWNIKWLKTFRTNIHHSLSCINMIVCKNLNYHYLSQQQNASIVTMSAFWSIWLSLNCTPLYISPVDYHIVCVVVIIAVDPCHCSWTVNACHEILLSHLLSCTSFFIVSICYFIVRAYLWHMLSLSHLFNITVFTLVSVGSLPLLHLFVNAHLWDCSIIFHLLSVFFGAPVRLCSIKSHLSSVFFVDVWVTSHLSFFIVS